MALSATPTSIPEVLLITPQVFNDARGHFFESFNARAFAAATGVETSFVQDNQSLSTQGVLRGLHYQITYPQGKLIRVTEGSIFDVAVDLRRSSPTCGQWVGQVLSAENRQQLWIPPGFAHGFVVLSERAECLYKTTAYWHPQSERCLRWDDPALAIEWPIDFTPQVAPRDAAAPDFAQAELFE